MTRMSRSPLTTPRAGHTHVMPTSSQAASSLPAEGRSSATAVSRRLLLSDAALTGLAFSLALLGGCAGQQAGNVNDASADGSQAGTPPSAVWDAPAPSITGENNEAENAQATEGGVESTAFVPDEGTGIVRFSEMDSSELDAELASSDSLLAQKGSADADSQVASAASQAADASIPATVAFRPADTGVQPQAELAYPYLGLTAKLPQELQDAMESREMFVLATDAYTDDAQHVRYASLAFCPLTDEQRTREVDALDSKAWEAELQRAGVLGIYQRELTDQLDELTGCDTHARLGESPDGAYVYYLSTSSRASQETIDLLGGIEVDISQMRALDPLEGFSAFSIGRTEGVATIGEWEAVDIDGQAHSSRELFGGARLTLVNVLTTWCTSCIMEMPELERLRAEVAERGLDVNVVAVVLDAVDEKGRPDEFALEQARTLRDHIGAQFPFLTPDPSEMNGRLTGLESFPESFLVDGEGRIVGSTYSGARTAEDWLEIVERELASLKE